MSLTAISKNKMKIIAHRSGTDIFPEQTILSARNSISLGADFIEIDVRFTSDGEAVINHDSTAERLYKIKRDIDEMTLEEFMSLRRSDDAAFAAHRFEDFLRLVSAPLLLHIKEGGEYIEKIAGLVKKYGREADTVFGVQSVNDLSLVKKFSPVSKILAFMPKAENAAEFAAAGADYIRLWENWCSTENINAVAATGRELWIMSNSPVVGEVTNGCYEFYEKCGAAAVLVNKVSPAVEFYKNTK